METKKLNALVVDDSRVMRNMIMQSLNQTGLAAFEFFEAGNGSEAMDKLDSETIDIIFCDWNMPGMNGIEFARHVRQTSWFSHIPLVMITSESGEGKQQNAFDQARITCYVTKPFTAEDLIKKIAPVIFDLKKKLAQSPSKPAAPAAAKPAAAAPAPKPAGGGFFNKLMK